MTVSPTPPDAKAYEQLCQDFRALNTILWQTPLIVMTMTGGLWYAATNFSLTSIGRSALLCFAAVANVVMIAALYRLRGIMNKVQVRIIDYDKRPKPGFNYLTVSLFAALLLLSGLGSFLAAIDPSAVFASKAGHIKLELTRG